jgi:hypothetical protein
LGLLFCSSLFTLVHALNFELQSVDLPEPGGPMKKTTNIVLDRCINKIN